MPADPDARILSRLIKNAKSRGEDPLTPLIDAYLMKRENSPNRLTSYTMPTKPRVRPGGRLSPSAIGGCFRQAAFRFAGMPGSRRIDPQRALIFEQGDWQHHKWQFRVLDMEAVLGPKKIKVLSTEKLVTIPELFISGNSDNGLRLVTSTGERWRVVVDWKSINDNGFSYVSRRDEPVEEHVKQLTTYGKAHGYARGILVYDNKNNQEFKVFVIEFEDTVWNEIAEWCEEVISMLEAESLPPMHPDCEAGNFLWERCPYSVHCFGRETPVKIRRKMYKDFPGVESAWEEGKRAVEEDER